MLVLITSTMSFAALKIQKRACYLSRLTKLSISKHLYVRQKMYLLKCTTKKYGAKESFAFAVVQ